MSEGQIEVMPYKPDVKKWDIKPLDKFVGKVADKSLQYQMGVTPQDPDDPEWCIFLVTVIKEATNNRFGKILECRVTSGFRIKAIGNQLKAGFLYYLLVAAYETFKREWDNRTANTHVSHYILDKPEFPDYERYLQLAITGAGTSLQ